MRTAALSLVALFVLSSCTGARRPDVAVASSPAPTTPPAAASGEPPTVTPPDAAAATSPMALYARGNAEYDAKAFTSCAQTLDQALALAADARQRETFAYASACCHSLAGNAKEAFARLETAADAGFRDLAHLDKDPDLESLRGDPRWPLLVGRVKAAEVAYLASVNAELKALFDADQADRTGPMHPEVMTRDAQRRARTDEIVKAGGAKAADDWFHAAMVFQHGNSVEDIARAHELAAKALEVDPDHRGARWLFAASEDRWLMRHKKPQLYGTQFVKQGGKWVLYEVDPSISDEERAKYNVPPLSAARARAEQMNARSAQGH